MADSTHSCDHTCPRNVVSKNNKDSHDLKTTTTKSFATRDCSVLAELALTFAIKGQLGLGQGFVFDF